MNWQLLLLALGLALIMEGPPYFLFPEGTLRTLRQMESLGPEAVRLFGFAALVLGLLLLLIGRSVG